MFEIPNTRSSAEPFLTYSDRRDLRKIVWRSFANRGGNKDHHDNTTAVIPRILKRRVEKAAILGRATCGDWKLSEDMAHTPQAAIDLMMQVWPSAGARILEEAQAMQAIADRDGAWIVIAPWDHRYYAEKVRQ